MPPEQPLLRMPDLDASRSRRRQQAVEQRRRCEAGGREGEGCGSGAEEEVEAVVELHPLARCCPVPAGCSDGRGSAGEDGGDGSGSAGQGWRRWARTAGRSADAANTPPWMRACSGKGRWRRVNGMDKSVGLDVAQMWDLGLK